MRALVTAGGTSEPIDDVRVVTNLSSGRLGAAIANALAERGAQVTLLAGRALASHPEWLDRRVQMEPFGGFADLRSALARHAQPRPDVVFMAAAVSDYSPVRSHGKLPSAADELVVVMKRNPKLLSTLRDQLGPSVKLVGFKLLSGVREETLIDTARHQIARDRLDLCVANDLAELHGDAHPLWLVPRTGDPVRVVGTKLEVARRIVEYALDAGALRAEGAEVDTALAAALDLAPGPALHPWLARNLPHRVVRAVGSVGIPTATVAFPWPPGTLEEAHAIARAVAECGSEAEEGFVVDLPHPAGADGRGGAQVIGVRDVPAAAAEWEQRRNELIVHGQVHPVPVLVRGRPVGAVVWVDGDRRDLWIAPPYRGAGLGDRAALRLDALGWRVRSHDWFAARGWRALPEDPATMAPPSVQTWWRAGASVCLFDVVSRTVLLGQRRDGPYAGSWAFPGGRQQPGEEALAAGLRELAEETGISVEDPLVLAQHEVHAGNFRITCSVVAVFQRAEPTPTAEMAAQWVDLAQANRLRGVTAGTRRVLQSLP